MAKQASRLTSRELIAALAEVTFPCRSSLTLVTANNSLPFACNSALTFASSVYIKLGSGLLFIYFKTSMYDIHRNYWQQQTLASLHSWPLQCHSPADTVSFQLPVLLDTPSVLSVHICATQNVITTNTNTSVQINFHYLKFQN